MEEAFATVVVVVAIGGALVAIFTLMSSRSAYDEIGRSSLALEEVRKEPPAGTRAAQVEQEAEIREIVASRNARRARRGEPPLDADAEIARLRSETAASVEIDAELRDEVRDLVVASNARRERRGQPPLDVEAEVERRLRELVDQ